jgi:hypothetical protein
VVIVEGVITSVGDMAPSFLKYQVLDPIAFGRATIAELYTLPRKSDSTYDSTYDAEKALCETEVQRRNRSQPVCHEFADAHRLLESAGFGKRWANSNRYAAQRLPSSPINLTGNARPCS